MISNNWQKVKQVLRTAQNPTHLQLLAKQHRLWQNTSWFYQAQSDIAQLTSADHWLAQLLLARPQQQQPRLAHNVPVIWSCSKHLHNTTYASCSLTLLEPHLQQAVAYQHNLSQQQLLLLQQHVLAILGKSAEYCTRIPVLADLPYANQTTRQILLQLGCASVATRHVLAISSLQHWDMCEPPLVSNLLQPAQSLAQYY